MKNIYAIICCLVSFQSFAQLERTLESPDAPVELTFHAPRNINLLTVEPISQKDLHFAIMHTFGTVDGGWRNLYGIDNGANIQFSLEYGFSDKFSLGAARSSLDRVYSFFGRYHLFQQTKNDKIPVSLSMMGGWSLNSSDYSFLPDPVINFTNRSSLSSQLMIARKFSETLSIQLSPMVAYFYEPVPIFLIQGTQNLYTALGLSGQYKLTGKTSLTFQYIANLNNTLKNNLGIGLDFEAGGHVFQLYVVTSQALNEPYLLAGGNGVPGEGFRIGFNVNRVFATGRK
jgi:hypothetical protein